MKTLLAFLLLLASTAHAGEKPNVPATACGPSDVRFEVKTTKDRPVDAQAEEGKALVYVVEVWDRSAGTLGGITTRVGLDGEWIGANHGDSYFYFNVDPGEHHLCANWQSSFKRYAKKLALTGFTAEAGKVYYFRAKVTYIASNAGQLTSLELEPLNEDQGKYLVASSSFSKYTKK